LVSWATPYLDPLFSVEHDYLPQKSIQLREGPWAPIFWINKFLSNHKVFIMRAKVNPLWKKSVEIIKGERHMRPLPLPVSNDSPR